AGSTAVQELAFTLGNGMYYVRRAKEERGMSPDELGPHLSVFFNSHHDIFEEIAQFRAARRIWADFMRNEMGAKNPKAWQLRFHTQTAGCSCTAQQPEINIVRTAYQALAAVLGGTQSLHTNSYDEALALPTEKAVRIALRTQQILAHESGVTNSIDPLAGSYFIESLTDETEEAARKYFDEIERRGGMLRCVESGYIQREIADAAYRYQKEIDARERVIVGVNEYTDTEEGDATAILKITEHARETQVKRLGDVHKGRDKQRVEAALDGLVKAASRPNENTMPHFLDCVEAYATLGEIRRALVSVWGEYREAAEI
ncbi:MAG: methylmalonyl-CoA mutase family protein, partial [Methanobacteriota archaeon]